MLIAGDLYDDVRTVRRRAAAGRPSPAEPCADTGIEVIAIAGNHDSAATFDAYRPLMGAAGITPVGSVRPRTAAAWCSFNARSTGERVNVAVLPFLSQRYAVRAAQLIASTPSENVGDYDQMVREVIANLAESFTAGRGQRGDGAPDRAPAARSAAASGPRSRSSNTTCRPAFSRSRPTTWRWVTCTGGRRCPAPCPVVYSGSPFAVDFGEQDNTHVVCLVRGHPDHPGQDHRHPDHRRPAAADRARHGRRTAWPAPTSSATTSCGSMSGSPPAPGLREAITDALPNALEVRIDPEFAAAVNPAAAHGQPGRPLAR